MNSFARFTRGCSASLISALLTVGCFAEGPLPPVPEPETAWAPQELNPAEDNSPSYTELTFVERLGLVDGTNCEEWPKDFRLSQSYPEGLPPSAAARGEVSPPPTQQVAGMDPSDLSSFLDDLLAELEGHDLDDATTFGSKYGFEIREIPDPTMSGPMMVVAIDHVTRTGYALSRNWVCTEAMVERGHCALHRFDIDNMRPWNDPEADPTDPDPQSFAILVRSQAQPITTIDIESERFLSVVTAPTIFVRGDVVLDADTLFVSDTFSNAGSWALELAVNVGGHTTWHEAMSFEPKEGFLGVVAETVHSLDVNVFNGGGADALRLDDGYSVSLPPQSRTNGIGSTHQRSLLQVQPQDYFEIVEIRRDQPLERFEYSNLQRTGVLTDGENSGSSWYDATKTQYHQTTVVIRPRHAVRSRPVAPPDLFLACLDGAACDWRHIDTTALLFGNPALALEALDVGDFLDGTVGNEMQQHFMLSGDCGTRYVSNPDGGVQYYDPRTGATTFVHRDGTRVACGGSVDCNQLLREHPYRVENCKRKDQVRLCLEGRNGVQLCTTQGGYRPHTRSSWVSQLSDDFEDDFAGHFFGAITPQANLSSVGAFGAIGQTMLLNAPTFPTAQILTRGLYFELLHQSIENRDLRTGQVHTNWIDLLHRMEADLPADPLTSTAFDLTDEARMAQAFSLRTPRLRSALEWAGQARLNEAMGYGGNALGLSYGPVAAGWRLPPSSSGGQLYFLEQVRTRWTDVADEVERLASVVRQGRVQGSFRDHAQAGEALALRIEDAARAERVNVEAQIASVQATGQRLNDLMASFSTTFSDYVDGVGGIWSCDPLTPTGSPNSCADVMTSHIQTLHQQCVQQSKPKNPFGEVLKFIGNLAGGLGALIEVASTLSNAFTSGAQSFLDVHPGTALFQQNAASVLEDIAGVAKKVKDALDGAKKVGNFLEGVADAVLAGGHCKPSAPAYVNILNQLTDIQDMTTTLEAMTIELAEMEALISRFQADAQFYQSNRANLIALEEEAERMRLSYGQLKNASGDEANILAQFVTNACPLARSAVKASMRDVYRANRAVATTTGESWTQPHFYVPADPGDTASAQSQQPGWRRNPTEHGFLYSLWDTSRFRNRLFDGRGAAAPRSTIMKTLIERLDTFALQEICRATGPAGMPRGLALLEKELSGEALDAFLGRGGPSTGRLTFTLTLDEVSGAFDIAGADLNISKIRNPRGGFSDLSAPVVMGVAYEVVRPGGSQVFSSPNASWKGPGLAAPKTAWMPTTACVSGATRSDYRFSFNGQTKVAEGCLVSVRVPQLAVTSVSDLSGSSGPSALLTPFQSSSVGGTVFCSNSQAGLLPNAIQGWPALGAWTLAHDDLAAEAFLREGIASPTSSAMPDPAWLAANQDVTAIKLYFVLGAETLANGEPPRTRLVTP